MNGIYLKLQIVFERGLPVHISLKQLTSTYLLPMHTLDWFVFEGRYLGD